MPDARRMNRWFALVLLLLLAAGYAFHDTIRVFGRPRAARTSRGLLLSTRGRGAGIVPLGDALRAWTPEMGWGEPQPMDRPVIDLAVGDGRLLVLHETGYRVADDGEDAAVRANGAYPFEWVPEVAAGRDGTGIAVVGVRVDRSGARLLAAVLRGSRLEPVQGEVRVSRRPSALGMSADGAGWIVAWSEVEERTRLARFTAEGWGEPFEGPRPLATLSLAARDGEVLLAGAEAEQPGVQVWRRGPEGWESLPSVPLPDADLVQGRAGDCALVFRNGEAHLFAQVGLHVRHLVGLPATGRWETGDRVASMTAFDRGVIRAWIVAVLMAASGFIGAGAALVRRWRPGPIRLHVVIGGPPREALATVIERALAFGSDLALVFGAGWLMAGPAWGWRAMDFLGAPLWVHLLHWTVAFTYFTAGEALGGQTVGKRIVGIRVVGEAGERVSWSQAAVRTVFRLLDIFPDFGCLVGLVFVVNSTRLQRVGDRVARTLVVRDPIPTGGEQGGRHAT